MASFTRSDIRPPRPVLPKDTECPEDDKQCERNSQQPENGRFPHSGLSFPARLTTRILSMRLRAQLLQEAGQVLCMLFFLCKDPLQDFTRGGVVRADIGNHFTIAVDRDPFGNQVFRNHLHQ